MVPSPALLIKPACEEQQVGLDDPITSSVLFCPCHPPGKVHVKACGVTKILTGHSSYSWLSKGQVTALFASNHFPLALLITII